MRQEANQKNNNEQEINKKSRRNCGFSRPQDKKRSFRESSLKDNGVVGF
jgi:hypothetical protein